VGALTRLAWLAFRQRLYTRVVAEGFGDLQPSQVLLFRYPTIADLRPSELADQIGVSKQAMNDTLRDLERKGYVRLEKDPTDGRARLITFTERGSRLMEALFSAAAVVQDEWASEVGPERFAAFLATLKEIVDRFRTPVQNG
jgi:DNA-binding MarR family transcriptional regulator